MVSWPPSCITWWRWGLTRSAAQDSLPRWAPSAISHQVEIHPAHVNTLIRLKTYKVGLKSHRLTSKKELCHSNETWHVLNSTFPDTKCIVSFQINPRWVSNSGLWKVVVETFREWPGKLRKGVLFHQNNAPAHKSVVAMAAVHDRGFEVVDHPPCSPDLAPSDYFLFPNMKKTLLGSSIGQMMRSHLQLRTFWASGWELIYHRCCSTDGKSVCKAGETMLKKKPHVVQFMSACLWTFQPTLVQWYLFRCDQLILPNFYHFHLSHWPLG